MGQMTVCQTCGTKGYLDLLIHCVQCQIVAVHRYCVDGPPTFDDEEVIWSCEDCVPRMVKPASPCRKSERISTTIERVALRRSARRKWKTNLSLLKAKKPDNGKEIAATVITNTLNLDHMCKDGILDNQQGELEENTAPQVPQVSYDLKVDASETVKIENDTSSVLQQHKCVNSVNDVNEDTKKMRQGSMSRPLKRSTVTEQKSHELTPLITQKKDLNSENGVKIKDDSSVQHEHKGIDRLNDMDEDAKKKPQGSRNRAVKQSKKKPQGSRSRALKQSTVARQRSRQKKDSNSENGGKKMNLEAVVLTGQKDEDSSADLVSEDQSVKLEKNVGTQLCQQADLIKGRTSKAYDRKDGDSISEKGHKDGQSCNEIPSIPLDEHLSNSNSQIIKQPDRAEDKGSEVSEKTTADILHLPGEDTLSSCANSEHRSPRKKRRRLVIEMEYSDEEPAHALTGPSPILASDGGDCSHISSSKTHVGLDGQAPPQPSPTTPANVPALAPIVKLAKHLLTQPAPTKLDIQVPSRPIIDAIWSGYCGFSNSFNSESFELEAHLSNKALPIVHGAACALPKHIDFEIVPKRYAWPKTFKESPPTGDAIGLYFFPVCERDEKLYDNLLDRLIDRQLMLTSQINNLELLVFSSRELPEQEWRFQSKYYLWGVFKSAQGNNEPSQPRAIQISNPALSAPAYGPYDERYQKHKDLGITDGTRVCASPSRMGHSPNSQIHHKALNHFPEGTLPNDSRHSKPIYGMQSYDSRPDSYPRHDPANGRDYYQDYGKFRQHRAEFDSYGNDNREVSYHPKVRYRHKRGNDRILIQPKEENNWDHQKRARECNSIWVRPTEEKWDDRASRPRRRRRR